MKLITLALLAVLSTTAHANQAQSIKVLAMLQVCIDRTDIGMEKAHFIRLAMPVANILVSTGVTPSQMSYAVQLQIVEIRQSSADKIAGICKILLGEWT